MNYRIVHMIRQSVGLCSSVNVNGFLKVACFDELTRKLIFKCPNSESGDDDVFYKSVMEDLKMEYHFREDKDTGKHGYSSKSYVSAVCKNNLHGYQACRHLDRLNLTDGKTLCGGFYCYDESGRGRLTEFPQSEQDDLTSQTELLVCPKSSIPLIYEYGTEIIYFGINAPPDLENGYLYRPGGCDQSRINLSLLSSVKKIPHYRVDHTCDGSTICLKGEDELNCTVTESTEHTCTHYALKYHENREKTVPIFNYTRCAHFDRRMITMEVELVYPRSGLSMPYCLDYLDQTNCSDSARVGGYCEVGGYRASVSKYMVCLHRDNLTDIPVRLCQDGIENECFTFTTSDLAAKRNCEIHKHRMCDGVEDCPDKIDELHEMCQFMFQGFECERRFNIGRRMEIPATWIFDTMVDCIDGEDEKESILWSSCGNEAEKTKRVELSMKESQRQDCQNVFMCPAKDRKHDRRAGFVKFAQLCDGRESCDKRGENYVCSISRDSPQIIKSADSLGPNVIDLCIGYASCEMAAFIRPWGKVFGENEIRVHIPSAKVDCTDLFGERYLYMSCMDRCLNATCPLYNRTLMHHSCPLQFSDRTYALANNSFLTFVTKENGTFRQDYLECDNSKCIRYEQVCDLVNDCGDMSDEKNCKNNMICENTLNSTQHQFLSIAQRCDGIYDCSDLSDECNEFCGKRILENWALRVICWILGVLAVVFNAITLLNGLKTLPDCALEPMFFTKILASLFGMGDLTIGFYLIILSLYDSVVYGDSFCKQQADWLTGYVCAGLGVISTIGSQLSIFSMTALSVVRMTGIARNDLIRPPTVQKKSVMRILSLAAAIIIASLSLALVPLVPTLEDYFVQGMYYEPDENYKLFVGFPNKVRHLRILRSYFNTTNLTAALSWREIGEKVDDMFSQQYGTATRRPVHFYGNDGVCLFRYFIRSDDARRSRNTLDNESQITDAKGDAILWLILVLNLLCFIVMSICYSVIMIKNVLSARRSGQITNPDRLKEQKSMQNKIALIIMTDFLCWVPFIIVCILHNLGYVDATKWYVNFAMAVLPLNSFINPFIYDTNIRDFLKLWLRRLNIYGYNWVRRTGNVLRRPTRDRPGNNAEADVGDAVVQYGPKTQEETERCVSVDKMDGPKDTVHNES